MDLYYVVWLVLGGFVLAQIYYFVMACTNTKNGNGFVTFFNPFNLFDPALFSELGNNYRKKSVKCLAVNFVLIVIGILILKLS